MDNNQHFEYSPGSKAKFVQSLLKWVEYWTCTNFLCFSLHSSPNDQRQQTDVSGSAGGRQVKHVSLVSEEAGEVGGASGRPEGRAAAARESRHEKHGREKKRQEYKFPLKSPNGRSEERGGKEIDRKKANCKFFADQLS